MIERGGALLEGRGLFERGGLAVLVVCLRHIVMQMRLVAIQTLLILE